MINPTIMKQKDIEILIEKYLNGETTPEEEKALAVEVSRDDAPQEWKIIAEMLGELTIDEALYDKMMAERNKKPRIIKLWPWVAAACVAAILLMIPTPPKSPLAPKEENTVAKVENLVPPKTEVMESVKTEPISQQKKEEKLMAQMSKSKSTIIQQKRKKPETVAETSHEDVAVTEPSHIEENYEEVISVADQRMEEFYDRFVDIQRRGESFSHRTSMMKQNYEERFTEL